jgi:hypothetical protein
MTRPPGSYCAPNRCYRGCCPGYPSQRASADFAHVHALQVATGRSQDRDELLGWFRRRGLGTQPVTLRAAGAHSP